jgi:hypothetical protein
MAAMTSCPKRPLLMPKYLMTTINVSYAAKSLPPCDGDLCVE